jgi:hypothetical protein
VYLFWQHIQQAATDDVFTSILRRESGQSDFESWTAPAGNWRIKRDRFRLIASGKPVSRTRIFYFRARAL